MEWMQKVFDPFGVASSFEKMQEAYVDNSTELLTMLTRLNLDLQSAGLQELAPLLEKHTPGDQDPQASLMELVRGYAKLSHRVHAVYRNWLKEYANGARGIEGREREHFIFWANQLICSMSPTNYFWTNPAAVQKCLNSKGESLASGMKNWIADASRGDNLVTIADMEAFQVGKNLATTPGSVVFRNELIELIQYTPQTESVRAVPVVFVQPSINKYYILDLTPEKSLVQYLLSNGFTVFMVSWKNPTSEMRQIAFDDYVFRGALKAVEVAGEICGVEQVHAVGFCIGGTILAALMAWLNRDQGQKPPIGHWTLFASMIDYSDPGEIGAFISEPAIEEIERVMAQDGYLDGKYMAMAFRMLRPDNLIWRYFAHNYLQGEMPPKSDFLYWNSDSTRLPATMASFYLREFYLKNNLIKADGIVLGNRPIDLRRITQPLYSVGAEQDHICPWRGTFRICNLVQASVRYALAEEGHIAGIVNPPSVRSRKSFWASDVAPETSPDDWLAAQSKQQGSWWVDWLNWLSGQCGPMQEPPPTGSAKYPALEAAPGKYVLEK